MSYLSVAYLESQFSWLLGGEQKTLKKRGKQAEEKSEQEGKRRIRGKSDNNNKHLWF